MKRARFTIHSQRGSALVAVVLVLMVMTLLGSALMTLTMNNLRLGDRQRRDAVSFNLAESAASRAALWVRTQSELGSLPTTTTTVYNSVAMGDGTYTATVTPNAANSTLDRKEFTVTADGTANGRTVSLQVGMRQSTFGKYAYFTDYEVSSVSGGVIWFKAGEKLDGPVHSNNTSDTDFHINYNGSTSPIFMHEVTASGDQIVYNPSPGPTSEAEFRKVFDEGSTGYELGVDPIPLPPNSDKQRNAAWGSVSGFPSTNGVTVPNNGSATTGGVYIKGDCTIDMSVVSGNQRFTIIQGSTTTTVTLNKSTNQTEVQVGSATPTYYDGLTNGVIFTDGNITSLQGTIADNQVSGGSIVKRNAFTICTDQGLSSSAAGGPRDGKKITITNHIQYQTPPDKTKPANDPANLAAGTLGIVSKDVGLSSSTPSDLKLHAVVLASGFDGSGNPMGSFWNETYNTGSGKGQLNLVGGLIQRRRGPVGTFNATTGAQVSGYAKNYSYDPRMADNPPPFFPTTMKFDQLSWKRL